MMEVAFCHDLWSLIGVNHQHVLPNNELPELWYQTYMYTMLQLSQVRMSRQFAYYYSVPYRVASFVSLSTCRANG